MNNATIDTIVADKARKEIKELVSDIQIADKAFLNLSTTVTAFSKKGFGVTTPKGLDGAIGDNEKLNRLFAEQSKQIKELEDKIKKLSASRARAKKLTSEEVVNQGILRRNADLLTKSNSKLATAYQRTSAKLAILKREYKNLAIQQQLGGKLNKAQITQMKRLERQILKTDGALKRVDRSVGESFRSVGTYTNAWKGLGNVVRASILAFGLYSGVQIARDIFADIKAIDGMNKALAQVTDTTENFARAKQFLNDVAEESGVKIIGLTTSYTKFLASAKTTNLTAADTENIFRQVAKAGAVMGLSTDDINGSFRALEQILSKGKVQAEEIRGQLGERLPGAFQILAKSMGLTTAELSKQLELGNVLSEEVLPNFARELEKTYSLDKIERVETLTSEQNRLSNAWTQFVESVDNGSGVISTALVSIFGALTDLITGFRILNLSVDEYNNSLKDDIASEAQKEALKGIREEAEKTGRAVSDVAKEYLEANAEYLKGLEAEEQALKDRNKVLTDTVQAGGLSNKAIKEITKEYEKNQAAIRNSAKTQGIYNGIINAANGVINEGTEEKKVENEWIIKTILSKSKEYTQDQLAIKTKEDLLAILASINRKRKEGNIALEGSIGYYSQLISSLKRTRDATARNNQEWGEQTREIEKLEKALEMLKIQFNGLSRVKAGGFADGVIEKTKEQIAAEKELLKAAKETTKAFGERNEAQIKTIQDALDKELEAEERKAEAKNIVINRAEEVANQINDIASGFLDAELSRIDKKEDANNAYFDGLLANEELSDEQRRRIEEQREVKSEELRQKREEVERKAFLMQQGFALAQIGIDLARTIVAINLAAATIDAVTLGTGGAIYRGVNIPLAIGLAGVQAATVVAQTIPAFKEGHQSGTYEGLARINDQKGGLYTEILERKGGSMEMYSGRDQLVSMNKGDKVHTASASQEIMHNMILSDLLSSNGILSPKENNIAGDIAKGMREGFGRMPRNKPQDTGGMAKAIAKELYLLKQIDRV